MTAPAAIHSSLEPATEDETWRTVLTPRVPGDETWKSPANASVATNVKAFLDRSQLLMQVPPFLLKLSASSKDGARLMPKPKASDRKAMASSHKARSSGPVIPVSIKQWILQALGLKDSEIRELFSQMDAMPHFAAEYIREIKAEWEALEGRNKMPPEAEFLYKDQALLEKVKALILRFVEVQQPAVVTGEKGKSFERTNDQAKDLHVTERCGDAESHDRIKQNEVIKLEESRIDLEVESNAIGKSFDYACGELKRSSSSTCTHLEPVSKEVISHRPLSPQQKHVLPSFIPVDEYIVKQCVVQPDSLGNPEYKSAYSPRDKRWYTVLFPALQPGKREDVQLLEDWLHNTMERSQCEDRDGHFTNLETAFMVHSIAFLEIVRQVDVHCEERGHLLFHLWRQLLRIFNQVMSCAEPNLEAKEDELKHLKSHTLVTGDQLSKTVHELETVQEQLRQQEVQMQKIKRCRLCAVENMTPTSRDEVVNNAKIKAAERKHVPNIIISEDYDEIKDVPKGVVGPRGSNANQHPDNAEKAASKFQQQKGMDSQSDSETIVTATGQASAGEEGISDEPEITGEKVQPLTDVVCREAATQTLEVVSKELRRCRSAPGRLQHIHGEEYQLSGTHMLEVSIAKQELTPTEVAAKEELEFLKLLGPPSKGSMPIPNRILSEEGGDRLQIFESLAVDTIGLLEKLPVTEGSLASTILSLLEKYCSLTGYVKTEIKEREGSQPEEPEDSVESDIDEKSRKRAKSTKGLQAKYYVPVGFAKMMKINTLPKKLKNFNVRQVSKLIASLYAAKIEADMVDDAANNERQTCCEFMYDFMLNQYGLKGIADANIHGVFKLIKNLISSKQIEKHHKVRLFSRFVGMEAHSYSELDLYLNLKLLQKAMSKPGAILPSDQDDGCTFINVSNLDLLMDESNLVQSYGSETAASTVIQKFAAKHTIIEKASPEIKKLIKENEVRKMDWDLMMEEILESCPRQEETKEIRRKATQFKTPLTKEKLQELENLFIAGDANQDGVLTFTEFRQIISAADPSVSTQSALRMFRETLMMMPDGGDSISPEAFATIAHSHGIKAPPDVVFNLLKNTWNQVQGDINEEKMREKVQKDEFEGLKESLLFLIAQRTNLADAIQVFRNLVLKFCGGNQTEEDVDDTSSIADSVSIIE